MGFGRERGIEDDLQLSGVRKWVGGGDRHLSGEDREGNTCIRLISPQGDPCDFDKKIVSRLVRTESQFQRMKQ